MTDAYFQYYELVNKFTKNFKRSPIGGHLDNGEPPDWTVSGRAWDRSVTITLTHDFHRRSHNVKAMLELAENIIAACNYVEEQNPDWASK